MIKRKNVENIKYSWEKSMFDTEILTFNTVKIIQINLGKTKEELDNIIKELKEDLLINEITYATYRIPANNFLMITVLQQNGFLLVDEIMTLEVNLVNPLTKYSPSIIRASLSDSKKIIQLAGRVFNGVSRYYHDPVILKEKADFLYEQWMKNSLEKKVADEVLIWKEKDQVLGFITIQKKGQIPLLGVSEKARGKGVGKGLIHAAMSMCRESGLEKLIIETQITNIPALRLYHSCGFKIINSYLTFRWHNKKD